MRRALALLIALGGCATAQPETAPAAADAEWVITPNGTADIATVTLVLPAGFALDSDQTGFSTPHFPWTCARSGPKAHWEFAFGTSTLKPDTPLKVNAASETLYAHFRVCGEIRASHVLAKVTPQAGFDTRLTFGIVQIRTPGKLTYRDSAFTNVLSAADVGGADFVLSPYTYLVHVDGGDAYRYEDPREFQSGRWLFGNFDVPLAAGRHAVATMWHEWATEKHEATFDVRLGERTVIDAPLAIPAPFTLHVTRTDPKTMPDAASPAPNVRCHVSGFNPDEGPSADVTREPFVMFAASDYWNCELRTRTLEGAVIDARQFYLFHGESFAAELRRIEVDDVLLTDLTPPQKVKGTFSVSSINSARGSGPFETRHGVDVFPGRWQVRVRYTTPVGVVKALSYEADL